MVTKYFEETYDNHKNGFYFLNEFLLIVLDASKTMLLSIKENQ